MMMRWEFWQMNVSCQKVIKMWKKIWFGIYLENVPWFWWKFDIVIKMLVPNNKVSLYFLQEFGSLWKTSTYDWQDSSIPVHLDILVSTSRSPPSLHWIIEFKGTFHVSITCFVFNLFILKIIDMNGFCLRLNLRDINVVPVLFRWWRDRDGDWERGGRRMCVVIAGIEICLKKVDIYLVYDSTLLN